MVVSAVVRLGWSGRPRRPSLEKGDPSVNHHLSRHTTRQSKREDEDWPNRKRLARLIPPMIANAPDGPAAEGAADASAPAEHDESENPTLLPAA
jgi:hypothetical protein